jgi:hypothetical protein
MKHQTISFNKSAIRLAGYCWLPFDHWIAAGVLVVSELLGIVEEIGHE